MSLCVCVRVDRESSNVSQAPLLMSEPPSSLPFLPSFSSFTLPLSLSHFPSFNWSTFFLVSLFSLFPSSLVSLVEPGDEIYSQALDPQRVCLCRCISPFPLCLAGSVRPSAALHNNRAQSKAEHSTFCAGRGGVGLSHRQKNECTSPWGIPSSPVFLYYIVQPLSLSLSQSSSVSLSFSLNCLITTSCISGQHSTDPPPTHTHTQNLASFLNFSKPNFHLCFFLARKRAPRTFLPSVCHLLGQMGLLLHEWTAHREVARGCAMMGGLCLSPNLTSILLCGCVERCVHECMQAWRDILGLIWLISH